MPNNDDREIIPSIKPERDEVASYRRSSRSESPRQSNFNGLLLFVIALMAVTMGVGGYVLFEVQKRLERSNELLLQGRKNIEELDSRLAATGTDVSRTLEDLESQVKTNFSEIDKLWALSHRQNKPDIRKNSRAIEGLQVELGGRVNTLDTAFTSLEGETRAMVQAVEIWREEISVDNDEILGQTLEIRRQLETQTDAQEADKRNLAALTRRVRDSEEAITAIDAYRRQINERLADLQRQIRTQAQTSGAGDFAQAEDVNL